VIVLQVSQIFDGRNYTPLMGIRERKEAMKGSLCFPYILLVPAFPCIYGNGERNCFLNEFARNR
jgi:hypothetical protein